MLLIYVGIEIEFEIEIHLPRFQYSSMLQIRIRKHGMEGGKDLLPERGMKVL